MRRNIIPSELHENSGKNEDERLSRRLKDFTLDWLYTSTSHGLPNIFRANLFYLKLIWTISFLASTTICILIVTRYILQFFQYPTNVNVAVNVETPTNFPAVTVCNLNPFYYTRAQSFVRNVLDKYNMSYILNLRREFDASKVVDVSKAAVYLIKSAMAVDRTLTLAQRENLGFTMSDMLISCTFNGQSCNESDFVYMYSFDYTNCYTFNGGYYANGSVSAVRQISNAGSGSSLEIELFIGDPKKDQYFVYNSGAYVAVHNQSVTPLLDSEGIEVATGLQNNLAIKRTFINNLPSPYSTCLFDVTSPDNYPSKLYKAMFTELGQKIYRQKNCLKMCYQKRILDMCNCFDSSLPNPFPTVNNTEMYACSSFTEAKCMLLVKTDFQSTPVNDQCAYNCPTECSFIYYDITPSVSLYPTDYYSAWLKLQAKVQAQFFDGRNTNSLSHGMLKLNVFYGSIDYMSITQTPAITWDALLGNVGGQLGLFIGISILSLAELVEYVLEIIRISISYYLINNNNKVENQK